MATIPSLAMKPSGYKEGKLYSFLPNTDDGDFTFSRGSNATRVNKDGLIEEVGVNVPRLDYSDSSCPSLLLEPTRTNLIDSSAGLFSGSWSGTRVSEGSTINALNGNDEAHKLIATSISSTHYREYAYNASSGSYTGSCFFKKGEYNVACIRISVDTYANRYAVYIDLNDGSFIEEVTIGSPTGTAYKIEDYGDGWYRLSVSITHTSGEVRMSLSNAPSNYANSNGLPSFMGNSLDGGYSWGAQLEEGSYATSYIPTDGIIATRLQDECTDAGDSSTFNSSEGVLFWEGCTLSTTASEDRYISIGDNSYLNNIQILIQTDGTLKIINVDKNANSNISDLGSSIDPLVYNKIALSYKSGDSKLYVNGVLVDSSVGLFDNDAITTMNLKHQGQNSNYFYGKTSDLRVYNTALTDLELEGISSWESFIAMANGQNYTIK